MTNGGDGGDAATAGTAAVLAPLLVEPARTGVFCDFDGTLSPIVDDPDAARPLDGATDALAALTGRMACVGVISGRPAAFLLRHVGVPGISLWGLHGLETVEDGRVVAVSGAEGWRAVVEDAADAAERELSGTAEVERKSLALTLHYRRTPEGESATREWAEQVAASTGLVLHPARMSFELRPPVPHGKDVTLEAAAAGLGAACFIGDDWGDVAAFDALDRLAAGKGLAAVRVAVASAEAPAELLDRADLVVDGPPGVVALLRSLAGPV